MDRVTLRAEVLLAGMGCPVCGGEKTKKARTCRTCYEKICPEATKAVDEVIETITKAKEGNEESAKGAFRREIVFGPILAQIKIDKSAVHHIAHGNIDQYLDCEKSVPGGFVSAYIFGATPEMRGKEVTAVIHLKKKEHRPGDVINYLRAQAIPDGVRSNVKICMLNQKDAGILAPDFPIEMVEERKGKVRKYAVGFQYVEKRDRLEADPLLSKLVETVCAG